jgi:hypothetical protein
MLGCWPNRGTVFCTSPNLQCPISRYRTSGLHNLFFRNPEKGDVAQGLGGIRKARTSNPTRGKGKRGGYRYMHLYLKHRDHVHLLFLLDKDEQEDLTTEQRRNLRLMVAELKRL